MWGGREREFVCVRVERLLVLYSFLEVPNQANAPSGPLNLSTLLWSLCYQEACLSEKKKGLQITEMSFYRKIPSISYKDHITYKANYWTPWRSPGFRHTTHRWELAGWLTKSKQLKYVGYSWLLFFSHSAKFVAECSVSGLWSSRKMETKMVHGNFSIIELCNNNPEVTVHGDRPKGRQKFKSGQVYFLPNLQQD